MDLPIGTKIRTNYGTGKHFGYTIIEVSQDADGLLYFTCACDQLRGRFYLNGYRWVGDRLIGQQYAPGSDGYLSNGGGSDGQGHHEIFVESAPAFQMALL